MVSPTYYGVCCDLESLAAIAHAHGLPLQVDEAHGPHLGFHPELPLSALEAGADLVVQSTHKVISGMTQASMLHLKGSRIDPNRVRNILQLLQSTSPNYVLMMSLDVARRQMALEGEVLLGQTLTLADQARARLNRIPGIFCFGPERIGSTPGFFDLDRTRLTVTVSGLRLKDVLKRKNPYLLRAIGIRTASELVEYLLQIHTQASDETIFGETFVEPIALAVSGGHKSSAKGIDLEVDAGTVYKAIAVKSGPNVFNSSQTARMNDEFADPSGALDWEKILRFNAG